jgi:hypothetical protein
VSTLEVMEAVKTWRRSKLCMKLPFVLRGRNYLVKMITGTTHPPPTMREPFAYVPVELESLWLVSGQQS